MLQAALQQMGIADVETLTVKDDYAATKASIQALLKQHDVLLCSGGISVGDYDYVGKALSEIGVKEISYNVKQKPGKPLFFGMKDEKLVFALPGNPASALTGFYVYVAKAIHILMGKSNPGLPRTHKRITTDYTLKGDRALFLKALIIGDEVQILEGQSSAMLYAFTQSNALVYMPTSRDFYLKGDAVECILLP
jgi:molybdopterin molybdotransferase